ncbi:MAG: ABC transporter permease [marine bacterium B5-7]|nr:MAG: ABC transporter permease [marine bacterium B5-7]
MKAQWCSRLGQFRREFRLAEFRLLLMALFFVATALSAVGLFGDRVERAMQLQTGALIGADALISSTRPIADEYTTLARAMGLDTAQTVSFLSMAVIDNDSRLARVKAVSDNYPLRGSVISRAIADVKETTGSNAEPIEGRSDAILQPGNAWVATSLARGLDNTDSSLTLGRSTFKATRQILLEPQGSLGSFRIAPRIFIRLDQLDDTGLISPASRASFRLLVRGTQAELDQFADAIEPRLQPYERMDVADLRRDEVSSTVGRVVSYLNLSILVSVILAIVAMALGAQGLWRRQIHAGALLRCLGGSHKKWLRSQALWYLGVAIPVGLAGAAFGALLQWFAVMLVHSASGVSLPPPGISPVIEVITLSVVAILAIMLPLVFAQGRVPVMTLLRSGQGDRIQAGSIGVLSVVILIAVLSVVLAGDIKLAGIVLLALAVAGVLFWIIIRVLLGGLAAAVPAHSSALYIGLKNLTSNARRSAWLASAFGVTVFALVLLGVVRGDLFDAWSKSVPADAPNLFLVNIQPDEVEPIGQFLDAQAESRERFYAIFRGRLIMIDGKTVSEDSFDNDSARHRASHEFNLTESDSLPEGNQLIEGKSFAVSGPGFSVEEGTAESLGLGIGSILFFDVGGIRIEAPVVNIRSVRWDSMRPNFFVLGSDGLFADAPRTYITAARVVDKTGRFTRMVNKDYPAVTVIDLEMIIKRLRDLVDQASTAVSVVFLFTLAAALLVLIGVLQGQRQARRAEIALLKTFGASRSIVRRTVVAEFALLGAIAGLVGGGLALFSGYMLADQVFGFIYDPAWRWLFLSAAGAAVVVGATGYWSIRSLMAVRPVRLLAG